MGEDKSGLLLVPNVFDLLQCKTCGTFYVPEATMTGKFKPHCNALILDEHLWRNASITEKLPDNTEKPPRRGSIIDIEV
jgi:hypothetical protein